MYTDLKSAIAPKYIYDNITITRDANYISIMSAFTIIEEYIKSNKLILYGGMSIDFALLAAGHKGIYADDSMPDYDFYSTNSYADSISIADMLYAKKLPNVSAINALHPTTRRVRINYINVADISYLPESIFNNMPYIEFKGIRAIHPMYQRLDQHRAMSVPYEGAPSETVYFRGSKDIERFKLLDKAYPIVIEPGLITDIQNSETKKIQIPLNIVNEEVLSGIPVYALMYSIINKKYPDECKQLCPMSVQFSKNTCEITIPKSINTEKICLLCSNFIKTHKKINTDSDHTKYFKRYMDDIKPRSIEILGKVHWDLYDCSKFPVTCVKISTIQKITNTLMKLDIQYSNIELYIAAAPNVLLYLLTLYYIESNPAYLYMYWSMCQLIEIAEHHINEYSDPDLFQELPLFLTAKVKNTRNIDFPYILSTQRAYETIHGLEDTVSKIIPTKGYFPNTSDLLPPTFDISSSWLFDMDGTELGPGQTFTKSDYDTIL